MALNLTAVLFAGGRSRRMGRDKAAMLFEGQPLWQRQLATLRGIAPAQLWLSAPAKPAWSPLELETIFDARPARGPLSGLVAGLERLQTSHLLALAIDVPRISPGHLRALWSRAEAGKGVVPVNGDYFEPLCAVYPIEAAPLARQALLAGSASLQLLARELIRQSRARPYVLSQAERLLYANLNCPADIAPEP